MSLRRIPLLPTLVVLAAVAVMVRLGFWQLDRLEQKELLLNRYSDRGSTFADVTNPDLPAQSALYHQTIVECAEASDWRAVAGRNAKGDPGFAHLAKCILPTNFYVTPKMIDERLVEVPAKTLASIDVVVGWSRAPQSPVWNGGTVRGIVAPNKEGIKVVADPPLAGLEANARPDPNDMPNNHLAYAVQWFLFALTALVIYAIALRRRLRAS